MSINFSGFVLAGGKSSRMKTDKAFLKIGDETFIERAVRTLAPVCQNVKIVLNHNQIENFKNAFPSFDFVVDRFPGRGALGGLHAALVACETDFAVVVACDLPLVSSEAIVKLVNVAAGGVESLEQQIGAFVPVQPDGRLQPLCAIYNKNLCLEPIEKLLGNQLSVSMRDLLASVRHARYIDWKDLGADENMFANINYPFEYENLNKKTS